MDTKPIKKLLRRYQGNLLSASAGELVRAFRLANGEMEKVINQAQIEYEEGKERQGKSEREKEKRGGKRCLNFVNCSYGKRRGQGEGGGKREAGKVREGKSQRGGREAGEVCEGGRE